jgi:uncharacterized membrane protein YhaH (DUF805 family)
MGFSEAIGLGYRQYFRLRGRATRPEYWYFILFITLSNIGGQVFLLMSKHPALGVGLRLVLDLISLVFSLTALSASIPAAVLQVRRLHDIGRSGWWTLLQLAVLVFGLAILVVGLVGHDHTAIFLGSVLTLAGFVLALVIFVFLVQPSQQGSNRYDTYR